MVYEIYLNKTIFTKESMKNIESKMLYWVERATVIFT